MNRLLHRLKSWTLQQESCCLWGRWGRSWSEATVWCWSTGATEPERKSAWLKAAGTKLGEWKLSVTATQQHQQVYAIKNKQTLAHMECCWCLFPAETSAAWTRTATCRSMAGLKTWSSEEERIFTRWRSNSFCTRTPKSRRRRWAQTARTQKTSHVLNVKSLVSLF